MGIVTVEKEPSADGYLRGQIWNREDGGKPDQFLVVKSLLTGADPDPQILTVYPFLSKTPDDRAFYAPDSRDYDYSNAPTDYPSFPPDPSPINYQSPLIGATTKAWVFRMNLGTMRKIAKARGMKYLLLVSLMSTTDDFGSLTPNYTGSISIGTQARQDSGAEYFDLDDLRHLRDDGDSIYPPETIRRLGRIDLVPVYTGIGTIDYTHLYYRHFSLNVFTLVVEAVSDAYYRENPGQPVARFYPQPTLIR